MDKCPAATDTLRRAAPAILAVWLGTFPFNEAQQAVVGCLTTIVGRVLRFYDFVWAGLIPLCKHDLLRHLSQLLVGLARRFGRRFAILPNTGEHASAQVQARDAFANGGEGAWTLGGSASAERRLLGARCKGFMGCLHGGENGLAGT